MVVAWALVLAGMLMPAVHTVAAAEEDALVGLIKASKARLATAEKVAHYKAVHGVAVEDIEREQAVLAAAHALSASYGLQADDARQFFVHQIEANKWIQFSLLADWAVSGDLPGGPVPDLATEVRPALDRLQTELLEGLARVAHIRAQATCAQTMSRAIYAYAESESLGPVQRAALVRSLAGVCN